MTSSCSLSPPTGCIIFWGVWVLGFGFWILDVGFRVLGLGVYGLGYLGLTGVPILGTLRPECVLYEYKGPEGSSPEALLGPPACVINTSGLENVPKHTF